MANKTKKATEVNDNNDVVEYDANGDVKLPKDRFFDPWRIAERDGLKAVVHEAIRMVTNYERHSGLRQRARKPADQKIFEETVEAVICDMIFVHLSGELRGSAVTLSNSVLGTKSRYRSSVFSKQLPSILRAMSSPEMAFIRMEVGWQKNFGNRGQRTLIWPAWRTAKRIEEHGICLMDIGRRQLRELIVLKSPKHDYWDESEYEDYDDTDLIIRMRNQMIEINEWLKSADIAIAEPVLAARTQISDRSLRRVFTRGSFESGGRLFGGFWQQMKKEHRLDYIAIDDEGVIGLDFGQMAVRTAYGIAKAKPPEGDLYQIADYLPVYRDGIKKLFNSLLSSQKPLSRKPKGTRDLLPPYPLSKLIEDISAKHPALAPLFFTAACHQLQFQESQIMVEVLLRLKRVGVVGLPIHDGLVVRCDAEDVAREIMEIVALEYTGVDIPVSTE